MSSRPFFYWYPADYLADTLHLSETEDLVYRRMLDLLWTYGPLPDDERQLARMLRMDVRKVRRALVALRPYFEQKSRRSLEEVGETSVELDHKKIRKQRMQVAEIAAKRSQAGRKGGLAKATNARATKTITKRTPLPPTDSEPVDNSASSKRRSSPAGSRGSATQRKNSTAGGKARGRPRAPMWSEHKPQAIMRAAAVLGVSTRGKANGALYPELAAAYKGAPPPQQSAVWVALEGERDEVKT